MELLLTRDFVWRHNGNTERRLCLSGNGPRTHHKMDQEILCQSFNEPSASLIIEFDSMPFSKSLLLAIHTKCCVYRLLMVLELDSAKYLN